MLGKAGLPDMKNPTGPHRIRSGWMLEAEGLRLIVVGEELA
jgi:hypothetical protein